ncbi:MAG TPA: HAD domain-containing protein [Candidatus Kapabacteria bacterium]|nr:HAD domain-containing protein [Candidatus Kapabacteria bacterium]
MKASEIKPKLRTVIFLDIDGVLQPDRNRERFNNDLYKLREELAAQYKKDDYLKWDPWDLGAVYYDWDKKAVERLRRLCVDTPAEIVLSSDWRRYSPLPRLKDYFRIHDLDHYLTDVVPLVDGKRRCGEIEEYLEYNPEIEKFVIIDDYHYDDFGKRFPEQFVYCEYLFTEECFNKAVNILTKM